MLHSWKALDDVAHPNDLSGLALFLVVPDAIRDQQNLARGMVVPGQLCIRQELGNGNVGVEQTIGLVQFMQPGSRSAAGRWKCFSPEKRKRILRARLK